MDCCERFPRKDPGVFDLLGSSLSCDETGLTALISICAYGLPNISWFRSRTPESRNLLPTLPKQVLPHPLSVLSADVLASFKADKSRRAPFFSTALHKFSMETAIPSHV